LKCLCKERRIRLIQLRGRPADKQCSWLEILRGFEQWQYVTQGALDWMWSSVTGHRNVVVLCDSHRMPRMRTMPLLYCKSLGGHGWVLCIGSSPGKLAANSKAVKLFSWQESVCLALKDAVSSGKLYLFPSSRHNQ
jgi:hypothetical protein